MKEGKKHAEDPPTKPAPFKIIDYTCALLVLFISFLVYLLTLTPTIAFHDTGELITVAYTLGIAHPPGYPLYTLFGKTFITIIPFGNISYDYGMNILRPLKERAVIFPYGDYCTFPIWYLKYVEKRREDIVVLTWMFLACGWHISSIKNINSDISFPFPNIPYKDLKYYNISQTINERLSRIINNNISKFPIYVGPGVKDKIKDFILCPEGVFFKLLKKEKPDGEIRFLIRKFGAFDRVSSLIFNNYSLAFNEMGNLYRKSNINKAIYFYKKALDIEPLYHNSRLNLVFCYIDKGEYDNARKELEIILEKDKDFNPALVHYAFRLIDANRGNKGN